MDHYLYLILSLAMAAVLAGLLVVRRDCWRPAVIAGSLGAIAGPISEFWYFHDYWRPPTLLGMAHASIEDVIFGFAVGGIAVIVYPVVSRSVIAPIATSGRLDPRRLILGLFLVCLAAMLIFSSLLHVNSIFVSSAVFLAFAGVMIARWPQLWRPSLFTGLLMLAIIIPIYAVLLDALDPGFLRHWLLAGTSYGVTILGHIPATELIWFFAFGCLAGAVFPFAALESA